MHFVIALLPSSSVSPQMRCSMISFVPCTENRSNTEVAFDIAINLQRIPATDYLNVKRTFPRPCVDLKQCLKRMRLIAI